MMISQNIVVWCALITIGTLNAVQAVNLRLYGETFNDYIATSLDNPLYILNSSYYNPLRPTLIYTFGYNGKTNGPATTAVCSAYIATKKRNVILFDWEEEAKVGILGIEIGYVISGAPNAKKVGEKLGDALIKFSQNGMIMSQLQLMGHSLGAHVMGYAGRQSRVKEQLIARITGLDPSRALFEEPLRTYSGLEPSCAKFVDVIHTNPGKYGVRKARGTVDLWANYNSDGLQPGCPVGTFETFTPEDLCSHDRSWRYLVESINSPTGFPASAASDYNAWVTSGGVSNNIIYLGDLVDTSKQGNFYLSTNSQPPYAKGEAGLKPN